MIVDLEATSFDLSDGSASRAILVRIVPHVEHRGHPKNRRETRWCAGPRLYRRRAGTPSVGSPIANVGTAAIELGQHGRSNITWTLLSSENSIR